MAYYYTAIFLEYKELREKWEGLISQPFKPSINSLKIETLWFKINLTYRISLISTNETKAYVQRIDIDNFFFFIFENL